MTKKHHSPNFFAEVLRADFLSFVRRIFQTCCPNQPFHDAPFLEVLCDFLVRNSRTGGRVCVINLPPRSLKSLIVSVALPAWCLGHDPALNIIVASYSDDLGEKHARDFRLIVESDWYRRTFPRVVLTKSAAREIVTSENGGRLTASVGGTLTGRGADLIIVDDPLKSQEAESEAEREKVNDWYRSTLVSRLNDKARGSIIVTMQRLHEWDLSGMLMQDPAVARLVLPAIAVQDERYALPGSRYVIRQAGTALHEAREPLTVLERIKGQIGSRLFEAQYQQDPVPAEGNILKVDWIHYGRPPTDRVPDRIVHAWDMAGKGGAKSDYSVGTIWHEVDRRYYLVDVIRVKLDYPDLKRLVVATATRDRADMVIVEDTALGAPIIQELWMSHSLPIIGVKPTAEKVTRFVAITNFFESGLVLLPPEAPWLEDYLKEILAFPSARYDDQVDSTTLAMEWFRERHYQPEIQIGLSTVGGGPRHW